MVLRVVGEIPARLGSQRLAQKNLRDMLGKPLIGWAIDAARAARSLTEIWVNSESEEIGRVAEAAGVGFFRRDPELAGDTTSSDAFNHDFIRKTGADVLVMINPVSPLVEPADIDGAVRFFTEGGYDSVISVRRERLHAFCRGRPLNFDPAGELPRTQDIPPIEICAWTVCVWRAVTFRAEFERSGRAVFSGKVGLYPVPFANSIKISDEEDFAVAEALLARRLANGQPPLRARE